MGSLHKNIQLMLEFLKAPFFVQHFSNYTLMIFLIMLSVILLSMPGFESPADIRRTGEFEVVYSSGHELFLYLMGRLGRDLGGT